MLWLNIERLLGRSLIHIHKLCISRIQPATGGEYIPNITTLFELYKFHFVCLLALITHKAGNVVLLIDHVNSFGWQSPFLFTLFVE